MKKILLLVLAVMPGLLFAQEKGNDKDVERIIITKKGDKNEKLNIVVDGEKITLNGKPLNNGDDAEVTVRRMKIKDLNSLSYMPGERIQREIRVAATPNRAMLGVSTEKTEKGAEVKTVTEESAAEKAGLKEGDIITAIDSRQIETPAELSEALKDKNPGDKVNIAYLRDGKKLTTTAELTQWKAPEALAFNFEPGSELGDIFDRLRIKPGNDGTRYWQFRNTPQLNIAGMMAGPKLGIKIQDTETGNGVKVIEVEKGSDADKAGLQEGDIIKEANTATLSSTDDLLAQKRKARPGSSLKLKVERNGKLQNIDLVFSKRIKTAEL